MLHLNRQADAQAFPSFGQTHWVAAFVGAPPARGKQAVPVVMVRNDHRFVWWIDGESEVDYFDSWIAI